MTSQFSIAQGDIPKPSVQRYLIYNHMRKWKAANPHNCWAFLLEKCSINLSFWRYCKDRLISKYLVVNFLTIFFFYTMCHLISSKSSLVVISTKLHDKLPLKKHEKYKSRDSVGSFSVFLKCQFLISQMSRRKQKMYVYQFIDEEITVQHNKLSVIIQVHLYNLMHSSKNVLSCSHCVGLIQDTHHDTAVRHRDVLKHVHAERPTAPLTLLGQSAHRS